MLALLVPGVGMGGGSAVTHTYPQIVYQADYASQQVLAADFAKQQVLKADYAKQQVYKADTGTP